MTDTRSHPIRQLLDVVAMGHVPHPDEIQSLGLDTKAVAKLADVIDRVTVARHAGDRTEARRIVTEEAPALIAQAPGRQDPNANETDPAKLAADVPRL